MTKTNRLDPLEENKVEGSGGKKPGGKKRSGSSKKKPAARTAPYPPPTDPLPDPPRPGSPPTTEAIPEPPPPPAAEPEKPAKKPVPMVAEKPVPPSDLPESASGKYEVLEEAKVSIRGHITAMPKGTVIHLAHYGRQVMTNMIKQGLKLKGVD
jgi:hypothetical protein